MAYAYEPLDLTSHSIRLLNILPGKADDVVALSLRTVDLGVVKFAYDAISYEWGPENNLQPIMIDGSKLMIRQNLWRCLKHCRDTEFRNQHHDNLWIDAICIAQHDTQERNHQVMQMSEIFRSARQVIAWLGFASIKTKLPSNAYECIHDSHHGTRMSGPALKTSRHAEEAWRKQLCLSMKHIADDVRLLFSNRYWRRLWVVQELRLARQAVCATGTSLIDIRQLRYVASLVQNDKLASMHIGDHQLDLIRYAGVSISAGEPLDSLARQYNQLECSEPLDRIYGLLGMTVGGRAFKVDYAIQASELLMRAIVFLQTQDEGRRSWCYAFEALAKHLHLHDTPLVLRTPICSLSEDQKCYITMTGIERLPAATGSFWSKITTQAENVQERQAAQSRVRWITFRITSDHALTFSTNGIGTWLRDIKFQDNDSYHTVYLPHLSTLMPATWPKMIQTVERHEEHQDSKVGVGSLVPGSNNNSVEGETSVEEVLMRELGEWDDEVDEDYEWQSLQVWCSYLVLAELHDYDILKRHGQLHVS